MEWRDFCEWRKSSNCWNWLCWDLRQNIQWRSKFQLWKKFSWDRFFWRIEMPILWQNSIKQKFLGIPHKHCTFTPNFGPNVFRPPLQKTTFFLILQESNHVIQVSQKNLNWAFTLHLFMKPKNKVVPSFK